MVVVVKVFLLGRVEPNRCSEPTWDADGTEWFSRVRHSVSFRCS